MTTRRRIATNLAFLSGGQGLSWIAAAISALIIPRYLGPDGIGTLWFAYALSTLISIGAGLGLRMYLTREVARDGESARLLTLSAMLLSLVAGVVAWSVTLAILFMSGATDTLKLVVGIISLSCILSLALGPMQSILLGMDRMHYSLFETFVTKGLGTALAVSLALLNFGVVLVAATDLVTTIIIFLLNLYWFRKFSFFHVAAQKAVYLRLLRGGFSFLVNDITFNVYLYLDGILLTTFTDTQIVGFYSVPTRLFGTLLVIPVLLSKAILPSLSRLAVSTPAALHDISTKTLTGLICLSLPVAIGCTVIAEPFIRFVYGDAFAPSVPIMIILGWTVLPTYLGIGLFQILVAQDKQGGWTKLMILACIANLALNAALIPLFQSQVHNGGIGAAIALLSTEVIIGIYGCVSVGRGIINRRLFFDALRALAVSAVMGAVIWPLRNTFLPVPVILGVSVYVIGVVLVGLVPLATVRNSLSSIQRWRQARVGVQ